jgi:hypothetical protein
MNERELVACEECGKAGEQAVMRLVGVVIDEQLHIHDLYCCAQCAQTLDEAVVVGQSDARSSGNE